MSRGTDDQDRLSRMRRGDALDMDKYELVESGPDVSDEVIDTSGDTDTAAALRLRAEMAAMFGINTDVLTSAARRSRGGVEADASANDANCEGAETPHDVAEVSKPVVEVEAAAKPHTQIDADDPDSVAAYMRNLMARNRGGRVVTERAPAPVVEPRREHKPLKAAVSEVARVDDLSDAVSNSTPAVRSPETVVPSCDDHSPQKLDDSSLDAAAGACLQKATRVRSELQLERQRLDSFRELANLSARSAVAKHNSATLKNSLVIQGVMTGVGVAATAALLTAPIWTGKSFVDWGFLTALFSIMMVCKMLYTVSLMRRTLSAVKDSGSSQQSMRNINSPSTSLTATKAATMVKPDRESAGSSCDTADAVVESAPVNDDVPCKVNASMPALAYDDVIPG